MASTHTNPDDRAQPGDDPEMPRPGYAFRSPGYVSDPDGDGLFGGITATFRDGSQVTIVPRGTDEEGRQRYAYSVTQEQVPRTLAAGDDLRSGVGEPVNYRKALAAWTSFACADAEAYQATMSGDAVQEWAYQHDDELSELALDLEGQDPDAEAEQATTAAADDVAADDRCDDTDGDVTTVDSLEIEAWVREAYWSLAREPGAIVTLHDLRQALPADLPRDQVDAALTNLADHSDVHVFPTSDQRHARPQDQAAALWLGGSHDHAVTMDATQHPDRVVERLSMRDAQRATSMVAALDDQTVADVAERLGVEPCDDPQVLRQRLIDTSAANHAAWLADAQQGAEDGTLLYRADTEPEWGAGWTDDDRQAAAEAAARLQDRAATDPAWAYVRQRADRWAQPQAPVEEPVQQPAADGDVNDNHASTATGDSSADGDQAPGATQQALSADNGHDDVDGM